MDRIDEHSDGRAERMPHRYPRGEKLTDEELNALAGLESPLVDALAGWVNRRLSCSSCLRCTRRCEVLEQPGLHMGEIEAAFEKLSALEGDRRASALIDLLCERPELYAALRRCSFCGYCTAPCSVHMNSPEKMRIWRELFADARIMEPDDSKLVMVDKDWHIFSAYRAIYNVAYPEFTLLDDLAAAGTDAEVSEDVFAGAAEALAEVPAGAGRVDTLFFPGCSLASYAPEVVRAVGGWLDGQGFDWALTLDCCGSPLMSAGLFERSIALRQKVAEQVEACGIKRVITVCPGCGEELAEVFPEDVEIVPLPEILIEFPAKFPGNQRTDSDATSALGDDSVVTVFDSCHDRYDNRHGTALRKLLSEGSLGTGRFVEMPHHGKDTLCCGAGGAVAGYDADLSRRRVERVIEEAAQTGADILLTVCPTCTYTIAQAQLTQDGPGGIDCRHYLEMVFDVRIPWETVFADLENMWTGEYGPWLAETFF